MYGWDALQQAALWWADALGVGQVAGIVDGNPQRVHTVVSDGGRQRLIVPLVNVLDPGAEGAGAGGAVTGIVQQLGVVLQPAAHAMAYDVVVRQLGGKDVLALDGPRQSVKAAHGSGNKAQRSPGGGGRGT